MVCIEMNIRKNRWSSGKREGGPMQGRVYFMEIKWESKGKGFFDILFNSKND